MISSKLKAALKKVLVPSKTMAVDTQNVDQENTEQSLVSEEIEAGHVVKDVSSLYSDYKDVLLKAIELGRAGKLVVSPENLSLAATINCNIRCIMCFSEKTDTYITAQEVNQLLSAKENKGVSFGQVKAIDLTSGESLLNPDIHLIVKQLKKTYPNAEISIITNGTLKVQKNIEEALKYIDRIGISVDGASQETFEFIRHGANFFRVIRNIQDIVKLKEHNKEGLCLLFVAMTINIHELPMWVRLAYYLDIKYLFVQKMEVRTGIEYKGIEKFALSNMPKEEIQKIIEETKNEVDKLGRYLTLTELVQSDMQAQDQSDDESQMRMCKTLWKWSPWLYKGEIGLSLGAACCHMPNSQYGTLAYESHLRNVSLIEIFNSNKYWDLRSGMLSGELAKTACAGCQYYRMYTWTEDELLELASVIKEL